ncbi:MAG: 2-oxoacid:acceptor oxidoreductase, gamma subunit, pyruvate/2-ketoisovalerate family [uncultured Acidilobus sp. CIS]|nr:MAG: 2-oxoacid:acceptor oxidoreductase, gamma subunit, pyruvate/2-ketoisovalerate family [uncultured Acidilobus sp. CIS]
MVMLEIRWHGRGGQGAVTASEVIASASILEGKYALAFPEFGAERRGAPVRAYTRVTDTPLIPRTPVERPDVVVILDRSLIKQNYVEGLKEGGIVVANTPAKPSELLEKLGLRGPYRAATVDATSIALKWLKANIVNTAILGALVRSTGVVKLDTVLEVIKSRFHGRVAEANVMAIKEAYESTQLSWG